MIIICSIMFLLEVFMVKMFSVKKYIFLEE